MDIGIADTINRHAALLIAEYLDRLDETMIRESRLAPGTPRPWYRSSLAAAFMGENDARDADRAWLFGSLAARTPGVTFDSLPALCDWDGLFASFRAEILARRAPENPHNAAAETRPAEVV